MLVRAIAARKTRNLRQEVNLFPVENHLLVGKEDGECGREGEGGGDVKGDMNVLLG